MAFAWFVMAVCAAVPALASSSDVSAVTQVPFEYRSGEILVSPTIDGSGPFTFLLDTDTSPSAIDLGLARKLRLRMDVPPGAGSGLGSAKTTVFPVTIPQVALGAERAANVEALALDLSGVSSHFGKHVDGVLGTSFLRGRVVRIDYACRVISFLPDAVNEPYAARFRDRGDGNNVSDDVWVGARRVTATFDTGDAGSMVVGAKGLSDLHLQNAAKAGKSVSAYGYNGAAAATDGTLPSVRIGNVVVHSPAARFLPTDTSPTDVNIGNKILERYIVTFDYQRGLLTLSPPRPCQSAR